MTVPGTADGVFRHVQFGGKGPGHAVEVPLAGSGDVGQQSRQLFQRFLMGTQFFYCRGVFQYAHKVPAQIRLFGHNAQGGFHIRGNRHRLEVIRRKIHFVQRIPPHHRQRTALGGEHDPILVFLIFIQKNESAGQRSVTAQIDLAAGGKPAKGIAGGLFYGKGRFG